jgi:hypothetical protein
MQTLSTRREVGAGGARPDAIDATIAELADALARLQWIHDYERAEAVHWGPQ